MADVINRVLDATGYKVNESRREENLKKSNSKVELVPQFSFKSKLIRKTFPPYNESKSEANQIATRWAKEKDTKSGDRKLISYYDNWYLIEAFDDMPMGYQIIAKLGKDEYNKNVGSIKQGEEYERSINEGIRGYGYGDAEQSSNSNDSSRQQRNDISISHMAETRNARESSEQKTKGNSQESNRDIQYSLEIGDETIN